MIFPERACFGTIAMIVLAVDRLMCPRTPPNFSHSAPWRLAPVILTLVPTGPALGENALMRGATTTLTAAPPVDWALGWGFAAGGTLPGLMVNGPTRTAGLPEPPSVIYTEPVGTPAGTTALTQVPFGSTLTDCAPTAPNETDLVPY